MVSYYGIKIILTGELDYHTYVRRQSLVACHGIIHIVRV